MTQFPVRTQSLRRDSKAVAGAKRRHTGVRPPPLAQLEAGVCSQERDTTGRRVRVCVCARGMCPATALGGQDSVPAVGSAHTHTHTRIHTHNTSGKLPGFNTDEFLVHAVEM